MEYQFKTSPFDHQRRIYRETRDMEAYGLLWEQGCGKTKPVIDTTGHLYLNDEVDALLVVAPNGVHRNWITDEIPTHMPDDILKKTKMMYWNSPKAGTKWHQNDFEKLVKHDGLAVFCVSYNGFTTERGKKAVWKFLKRRKTMYVVDEAHNIKTPKTQRTRSVTGSAKYSKYRRLLTGTPGDKPFDLYSQLKFIDPDIWAKRGMKNFYAFKQYFGTWFSRNQCLMEFGYDPGYDKLIEYKNVDELAAILKQYSDRVLKDDVLDLPAKLYTKHYFDMTPKQKAMYEELKANLELELESGLVIDGTMAIVRLLRLQQIACGYAVADSEEPVELCDTKNPRMDQSIAFLEELPHQAIVWARFTHDIDQMMDALGDEAVRYDGRLTEDECAHSKEVFQKGDAKYFIANSAKGSEGLTLVGAKTTMFYSNNFKFLQRLQAEDRNHRIGQDQNVLYVDVCANDTVDEHIIKALRAKFDIANQLTGDRLKDWI